MLGPGAAGKSIFSRRLGEATGIPVVELDAEFWSAALEATPKDEWVKRQEELCAPPRWILDGDLGPYDVLDTRLRRADTVVVFDLPTWMCAWRAWRRGRERADFWRWLLAWRWKWRAALFERIAADAGGATVTVVRRPREAADLLRQAAGGGAATF